MKFLTMLKETTWEYKFLSSPRGYGFQTQMAKLGYVFKERVTSKATGFTYDVYIKEETR